jgi:hypothetical protein
MRTLSLVLCALTLSAVSLGQSNYAAVSGTVKDAQALPVVHATVTFKALSTGATRSVSTDGSGLFYAPALLPDDYDVSTVRRASRQSRSTSIWKSDNSWLWTLL